MTSPIVQIVGPGRAGQSFFEALTSKGWNMKDPLGRDDDLSDVSKGVDLILITTPDREISTVASQIPKCEAVIAHIAGSMSLQSLKPHERIGSIHPLVSLPNPEIGKERLLNNAWFAVAGDPFMGKIVKTLGGTGFNLPDSNRTLYHATACIASNHLVVLLEQVRRLAAHINVPFEAFLNLSKGSMESVSTLSPKEALTGPATRKDEETLQSHLESLPKEELNLYKSLVEEIKRLTTQNGLEE
ncbi:MAG: DUF2520 domain-containing protein [Acidimicrobiales bacterium]|nr:DUF2520 domain-containing protein [Acidimicrobiales bacterium]HJM28645.1 DUF2520 domain-containing protein [Acidimicrobiales bacterium]